MDESIQKRLKRARKLAKKTQAEVAAAVGMSQPSYSELERGESRGTTLLPQIAHFLEVSAYWLATGEGPMKEWGGSLTGMEREILELWRDLPEDSQALVLKQFRALRDD